MIIIAALAPVPVIQWSDATLRAGVAAIQRGRARAAYPAAAAAAAAFARHPTPLAGALHGYTPVLNTLPVDGSVYYDPFLAAHAADPNYRLQVLKIGRNFAFYTGCLKMIIIFKRSNI